MLSKNTHEKADGRFDISVVEKYGLPIITVAIPNRENEQFTGGNLYICDNTIELADSQQIGRVPLFATVNKDGKDESVVQLSLTRELAAKCRLGIYIDKKKSDARLTKSHYIIDIGSYFPVPVSLQLERGTSIENALFKMSNQELFKIGITAIDGKDWSIAWSSDSAEDMDAIQSAFDEIGISAFGSCGHGRCGWYVDRTEFLRAQTALKRNDAIKGLGLEIVEPNFDNIH